MGHKAHIFQGPPPLTMPLFFWFNITYYL